MTFHGWLEIAIYVAVLTALTPLIGGYMARVFRGERVLLTPVLGPLERLVYRLLRADPSSEQNWKQYARSALVFSGVFWIGLYIVLRTQGIHPFNPEDFGSAPSDVTFNTTSSFITNTDWQYYGGETTMTYFSQMAGLAVQNFISAGVGISVAIAVIRGFSSRSGASLGNFWQDLTRTLLYVLVPISFVAALFLVSQGVIQNLSPYETFTTVGGADQTLALGPVASQEAIKLLGTNGGGFFNVNSAMPFENPSGLSNFVQMLMILVIPAGLTYVFGRYAGNRRQGWAIYSAMLLMFVAAVAVVYAAEAHGTPAQHLADVGGGNFEGKEARFGIGSSALFAAVTTVASCGAVNAAFDSLTGIGGLVPMFNMSTGEVVFGGVGSGLYGMLLFVVLAVFIAGLMVGRTPEYLGKKIESREIKLVMVGTLCRAARGARRHRARDRHEVGRSVGFQLRTAGLLGDALRVRLADEQQRLRVRGLHGLRSAERHQRGCVRDHLRRPARRPRDAVRPLRAARRRAGRRRCARLQARLTARPRHVPDRHPDLRGTPDLHDRDRRGAHILPRLPARPDRAGAHRPAVLTMRKELTTSVLAVVLFTVLLGLVYPLLTTGVAQGLFPNKADGSQIERDGKVVGSRLIGQSFAGRPRYFQSRPSVTDYNPAGTFFNNLGPNSRELQRPLQEEPRRVSEARGPLQPRSLGRGRAGRRGPDVRLGCRPAHLARRRRDPGAAGRGGPRPAPRSGPPARR